VLILGARLLASNIAFARSCERSRSPASERLGALLKSCCKQMGMSRAPTLWITEAATAPAVSGVFRARLLLPPSLAQDLSDDQLRLVFLHELAHIKCCDIALEWLWTAVNVLHWFNTRCCGWRGRAGGRIASWRATRWCSRLRVSQHAEGYGQMILRLVQSARNNARPMLAPGLVGMADVRLEVRRRITMIARFDDVSRRRSWVWWAGFALVALAGCAALTDPHDAGAAKAQANGPTTQHSETASARGRRGAGRSSVRKACRCQGTRRARPQHPGDQFPRACRSATPSNSCAMSPAPTSS
jgi:bla regulator protein BlaR1